MQGVEAPPVAFVATQMESVLGDLGADALKTGMLASRELAGVVATAAARAGLVHKRSVVVDPVLVTSSGTLLVAPGEVGRIASWLFPLAEVVPPAALRGGVPGSAGARRRGPLRPPAGQPVLAKGADRRRGEKRAASSGAAARPSRRRARCAFRAGR